MALINCRNCGKLVSDMANRCPHCGAPLQQVSPYGLRQPIYPSTPEQTSNGKGIAGLLLAICAFVLGILGGVMESHGSYFVCLPVLGLVLCVLGLVFSIIGVRKRPRGCAMAGLIISVIPGLPCNIGILSDYVRGVGTEINDAEITDMESPSTKTINGHEYVDLGLSVKWATCNVGASSPEEYGDYFAWGETSTKSEYTSENSKTYGKDDMGDIAGDPSYDAARANWGGTWRLPTEAEIKELADKCEKEWTIINGHKGYEVTGPSGNSIFLPAAGYRLTSRLSCDDLVGQYWSATPSEGIMGQLAYSLDFASYYFWQHWDNRYDGLPVRPVSD